MGLGCSFASTFLFMKLLVCFGLRFGCQQFSGNNFVQIRQPFQEPDCSATIRRLNLRIVGASKASTICGLRNGPIQLLPERL